MLCHGQGDQTTDPFYGGCCYVNGSICPLRWYIEPHTAGTVASAIVRDSTGASLGTVDAVARSYVGNNAQRRQRVYDAVQGTKYICSAVVRAVDASPAILNNRAQFDVAWAARPEYQPIADAWEAIGKPRNWCMIFGPAEGHCCFKEDAATNASKATTLTTTSVTIRRSATGAS